MPTGEVDVATLGGPASADVEGATLAAVDPSAGPARAAERARRQAPQLLSAGNATAQAFPAGPSDLGNTQSSAAGADAPRPLLPLHPQSPVREAEGGCVPIKDQFSTPTCAGGRRRVVGGA